MENQPNNFTYHLCPRRLYPIYLIAGSIAFIFLIIAIVFPFKGITILEIGNASLGISKLFVVIFCLIGILIAGIISWYQKKRSDGFVINLSENSIDFTFGIISRRTEDVEMHSINDVTLRQGPWDLFFKTADIIIYSHDFTTPIVKLDGLTLEDAHAINDFISEHASDSLVKYYAKTGTAPKPNIPPIQTTPSVQVPQPAQTPQTPIIKPPNPPPII